MNKCIDLKKKKELCWIFANEFLIIYNTFQNDTMILTARSWPKADQTRNIKVQIIFICVYFCTDFNIWRETVLLLHSLIFNVLFPIMWSDSWTCCICKMYRVRSEKKIHRVNRSVRNINCTCFFVLLTYSHLAKHALSYVTPLEPQTGCMFSGHAHLHFPLCATPTPLKRNYITSLIVR